MPVTQNDLVHKLVSSMMNSNLPLLCRILHRLFQRTNKIIEIIVMTLVIYLVYVKIERKYVLLSRRKTIKRKNSVLMLSLLQTVMIKIILIWLLINYWIVTMTKSNWMFYMYILTLFTIILYVVGTLIVPISQWKVGN